MDTLNKYKDIITKIEEMCTSTLAMAPYPISPVSSVTTVRTKQRKGRSHKPMLNYKYTKQWSKMGKDITETMLELTELCNIILEENTASKAEGEVKNSKHIRDFVNKYKEEVSTNKANIEKERQGNQTAVNNIISTLKDTVNKWKKVAHESLNEGEHLKYKDPKLYKEVKYHSYGPQFKERVAKNQQLQKQYQAAMQNTSDPAAVAILKGQKKRVDNIAKRYSKEERAKRFKKIGKQIQAQIVRDPKRMKKRKKK